jgi:hypothetical protein
VPAEEVDRVLAARRSEQEHLKAELKRLEEARDALKGEERKAAEGQVAEARKALERHEKEGLPFEQAYAVLDAGQIEDVAVQQKGDPARPGPVVHRRFLSALNGAELPADDPTSGRLQLANWIVDPANQLTARVMVNRIWLYHFGRGIVPTPNDFGRQGKPPSHPELLDWLSIRFIESGWSIKSLHREIMLSRTYRLSSRRDEQAIAADPSNELLGAFPRRRLDAEAIRDTLLFLAGNLDLTPGGAHPFPPQTEWKFTQHNPFKAVYETNRRSVYLMTQRIQRHPYLAIFDGADPSASTAFRGTSTTPLQALYLLNDEFVHAAAEGFVRRLRNEASEDERRLEIAYQLALGRNPGREEVESGIAFLAEVRRRLHEDGIQGDALEEQAWQALARVLFRLSEFVYID